MSRVLVCTWGGSEDALALGVEETLTLGRGLAGAIGAELALLVLGTTPRNAAEIAGRHGAAALDRVSDAIVFMLLNRKCGRIRACSARTRLCASASTLRRHCCET